MTKLLNRLNTTTLEPTKSKQGNIMQVQGTDYLEPTVETQEAKPLEELLISFQSTKRKATADSAVLTDYTTIRDMDSINEMVAEAMIKISDFTSNGQKQGFFKSKMSSALATIDPNDKWAGKWLNSSAESSKLEAINNSTITEIISKLVADIELQRDSVIEYIQNAASVKQSMELSLVTYENLKSKTQAVLDSAVEHSREFYDSQLLLSNLTASIESIRTDIASHVMPLIAAANISVTQITAILPTIENDLQAKMGFKAFQQKLTDLNQMVKQTSDMASKVGETIRKEINSTVYESIKMLGETGIDVDRMRAIANDEAKHQAKIKEVTLKTQAKISKTFSDVQQLALETAKTRNENQNLILEDYSRGN